MENFFSAIIVVSSNPCVGPLSTCTEEPTSAPNPPLGNQKVSFP